MIKTVELNPYIVATQLTLNLQARWGELVDTDYGGEPIGFNMDLLREIILENLND